MIPLGHAEMKVVGLSQNEFALKEGRTSGTILGAVVVIIRIIYLNRIENERKLKIRLPVFLDYSGCLPVPSSSITVYPQMFWLDSLSGN
jgi:hypothetical protein